MHLICTQDNGVRFLIPAPKIPIDVDRLGGQQDSIAVLWLICNYNQVHHTRRENFTRDGALTFYKNVKNTSPFYWVMGY